MKIRITRVFSLSIGMIALAPACGSDLDLTSDQGNAGQLGVRQGQAGASQAGPSQASPIETSPNETDPNETDPKEAGQGGAGQGAAAEDAEDAEAGIEASASPLVGVNCGAEPPEQLDACDLEANVCSWSGPDEANPGFNYYRECACLEVGENDLRWHCYQNISGLGSCPATRPEHGSSCLGNFGSSCRYPERTECGCEAGGSEQWECTGPAPLPEHLLPPVDPSPDLSIVELGEEGRSAWCRWFVDAAGGPGSAPRADAAVDEDGFVINTGCSFGSGFPCNAAVAPLSPAQCAQNLALSTCTAPIAELTDCVATVYRSECRPPEHGCARFFEKPGCAGTIAVPADQSSADFSLLNACSVRVR
jgi:hypothetical protein